MRVHARVWVLSLICGVLLAGLVPAAAQAAVSIEKFVAVNCEEEECAEKTTEINLGPPFGNQEYSEPQAPSKVEAENEGALQAGQRVPFGITDFKIATEGALPTEKPSGTITHIRTDVAPGLATNPFAVTQCSQANFGQEEARVAGTGFFPAVNCPESRIGENKATVYVAAAGIDLAVSGLAYNLVPRPPTEGKPGLASEFGVALKLPIAISAGALANEYFPFLKSKGVVITKKEEEEAEAKQYFAHTLIEGNVEWGKQAKGTNQGDYHDYFEIEVSPTLPLISSRLVFEGTNGKGDFITNATSCPGNNTTTLKLTDSEANTVAEKYTTPVGLKGCNGEAGFEELLFEPTFKLSQSSTASDQPTEVTAEASEPHAPTENDQSQVQSASFTLPEGMTLNPSAAHGLEACTPGQAHEVETEKFSEAFGVECPTGSKIGTVSLNVPTLPDGTLTGSAYLGGPESGPITGPPFTMYVVANSERYGVSVRLVAHVIPNEATGQLTTVFSKPPEQPFTNLAIHFDRGVLAPVANPLVCGTPQGSSSFSPTSKPASPENAAFGISVTGCAATLPFALTQSTENEVETAGSHTSYSFNLARSDGNQYLKTIKTSLPLGLVGAIPDVTLCAEAAANAGTCGAASKIGTVTVLAGAGNSPFSFQGSAYMTGPYKGAPYGMSIVVPSIAGPFNLGPVVTRATVNIDKTTAQVTAESVLPTIVKGIPLRLRSINLTINRQGFLYNPTNCATQATLSTLGSTEGATQSGLSSPFTVTGCENLKLAPKFAATTSSKVSRANGTSLVTTLTQLPGESNIKSVKVQLPRQLPSRDTTLKQACTAATFEADLTKCPAGSIVGTAEAVSPTLPGTMKGKAYFVAHGNAAFPDLDLVLEDQGVQIILVGNTDITKGITTTTFASTPDVPVSSVTVSLPAKSNSAVSGFGDLCHKPLLMPTTITGQNGKVTKLNTVIAVSSCGVKVVGRKVVGNTAILTIQTFAAGRISGSGSGVKTTARTLSGASKATTLKVPLSSSGRGKRKPLKVKIRVGFVPKKKGAHSTASVTVTYR
jgi:hypothetical protein